jgi:hypothetical protein
MGRTAQVLNRSGGSGKKKAAPPVASKKKKQTSKAGSSSGVSKSASKLSAKKASRAAAEAAKMAAALKVKKASAKADAKKAEKEKATQAALKLAKKEETCRARLKKKEEDKEKNAARADKRAGTNQRTRSTIRKFNARARDGASSCQTTLSNSSVKRMVSFAIPKPHMLRSEDVETVCVAAGSADRKDDAAKMTMPSKALSHLASWICQNVESMTRRTVLSSSAQGETVVRLGASSLDDEALRLAKVFENDDFVAPRLLTEAGWDARCWDSDAKKVVPAEPLFEEKSEERVQPKKGAKKSGSKKKAGKC